MGLCLLCDWRVAFPALGRPLVSTGDCPLTESLRLFSVSFSLYNSHQLCYRFNSRATISDLVFLALLSLEWHFRHLNNFNIRGG